MAVTILVMMASSAAADRVALGFLTGRVLEAAEIIAGVVGLLAILTLRQDLSGLNAIEQALAGARDSTLMSVRGSMVHPDTRPGTTEE